MIDVDAIVLPWLQRHRAELPDLELFDVHTHIGRNDPDGFKQTASELIAQLGMAGATAAVFPSAEPDGYPGPNDESIAAARASQGVLQAFGRIDPHNGADAEARRCIDAGARGLKLHPRAEGFTLSHPGVREVALVADEHRVPVLIHAGRGIPALGEDTVRLSGEFTRARFILAHAAISDLAWLWKVLPEHPNLFVDTAWWAPSDVCALLALAPPGQVLWASDSPYGSPVCAAIQCLRCALQMGLTPEQIRSVMGEQSLRLLAREDALDVGPAPGAPAAALHPLMERVVMHLTATMGRAFGGADITEPLALARLACATGDDIPHADVMHTIVHLLDLFEANLAPPPPGRAFPAAARFLIFALFVARTPDIPLGPLPAV